MSDLIYRFQMIRSALAFNFPRYKYPKHHSAADKNLYNAIYKLRQGDHIRIFPVYTDMSRIFVLDAFIPEITRVLYHCRAHCRRKNIHMRFNVEYNIADKFDPDFHIKLYRFL